MDLGDARSEVGKKKEMDQEKDLERWWQEEMKRCLEQRLWKNERLERRMIDIPCLMILLMNLLWDLKRNLI